jgi:hypothetical protein
VGEAEGRADEARLLARLAGYDVEDFGGEGEEQEAAVGVTVPAAQTR